MSETPTVKTLTEDEIKKNLPSTGWERILSIYDGYKNGIMTFELDALRTVLKASFSVGFLGGGISGYTVAADRYSMHSTGKTFLSPRDATRRKLDFSIVMFMKKGFANGLRTSALAGSVVFFTTHLAAYRDHFSYYYFPLVSGATTGILHGGLV